MSDEENNYEEQYQEVEPFSPEEATAKSQELQQLEQAIGPEPRPADFTDYDEYVKSLTDWQVKKNDYEYRSRILKDNPHADASIVMAEAVRQGLEADRATQALAQAEAQKQLTPFPPDPHAGERAELTRLSMEYSKQAIMNKESGNIQKYHDWRQRQLQVERDLEKLPPTPEKEYVAAVRDYELDQAMKHVTDPSHAQDQVWQHPRMKNDAPLAIIEANQRARTTIRLPLETSQYGSLLPCEPKNMTTIELDADQMRRFKEAIGGLSPKQKEDADTVLRQSWAILHRLGYAAGAKPVMQKKAAKKAEDPDTTENPDAMSWKRFCEWRQETEDRRRGRPRQGFVIPRKNR